MVSVLLEDCVFPNEKFLLILMMVSGMKIPGYEMQLSRLPRGCPFSLRDLWRAGSKGAAPF